MRHTVIASIGLICALALGPAVASAQPSSPARSYSAQSDCARAKQAGRACQLTFEQGDEIGGDRPTAGGDQVTGRHDLVFSSLITVRASFRPEIIYTAEEL